MWGGWRAEGCAPRFFQTRESEPACFLRRPCAGGEGLGTGVSNVPPLHADPRPGPSSQGYASTLTTHTLPCCSWNQLHSTKRVPAVPISCWCSACAHRGDFQRGCLYPNTSNELLPSSPRSAIPTSMARGRKALSTWAPSGLSSVGMVTLQAFL